MTVLRSRPGLVLMACVLSLAATLATACFEPEIPDGLICSANGECPSGQTCGGAGFCVFIDEAKDDLATLGPDAGAIDAGLDADIEPDAYVPPDPTIQTLEFEYTGVITSFVVPDGVTEVTIEAFGAEGGAGNSTEVGGKGARIKGDVAVAPGDTLRILVGGRGADAAPVGTNLNEQGGGSGGGGSFVVKSTGTVLVIAGGGGGATYGINKVDGGPGQITEAGQPGGGGTYGGAGGDPGLGGHTNNNTGGYHVGTGGGGFATGGVGLSDGNTASFGTNNAPGSSYLDGGAGGIGGSKGRNGGFGGGGSAGFAGGGGGGYGGGGSGWYAATDYGGGGGGSYNGGGNQVNEPGVRAGDGLVRISWQE